VRPGVRVIVVAAMASMLVLAAGGQMGHDAGDALATVAAFLLLAGVRIVVRSATVVGVLGTSHLMSCCWQAADAAESAL
jgi:hypothetical protein